MTRPRSVITGLGLITPIGRTADAVSAGLRTGTLPTAEHDCAADGEFDYYGCRVFAGETTAWKNFSAYDESVRYGAYAAETALVDAGLAAPWSDPDRIGAVVSSSKGGTKKVFGGRIDAAAFAEAWPSTLSSVLARHFGIAGPVFGVAAACATGTQTIIEAARMIEDERVDICLAGSADASAQALMAAGYRRLGVYGTAPMRPYDRRRNGFVIGEGAAMVVVENEVHARSRGAQIYGAIDGWAVGQEVAHPVRYDVAGRALADVLQRAHRVAGSPMLDYVNTHGTATLAGDRYEALQLHKAFGAEIAQIACSSTKAFTGHMLGAAGAVEFALMLIAMRDGFIPPTATCTEYDQTCRLDVVPQFSRAKEIRHALTFSMGFGGQISAIVVGQRNER